MGCDIHLVLEKKDTNTGRWVGLHDFSRDILDATSAKRLSINFPARHRNYERFAALAGVRGEGPEPKGLPEDASDLTRMVLDNDSDLHSHTWYSLKEAVEIFDRTDGSPIAQKVAAKLTGETLIGPLHRYFGIEVDSQFDKIENYRLCIAFDN